MATENDKRFASARGRSAVLVGACIALSVAMLFVSTWAKVSRYDTHAAPSRHFSTSVKVARVLFHSWIGLEAPAVVFAFSSVPAPHQNAAVLHVEPPLACATAAVLLFPSLRAPPASV
jgi:hypothetical protein